jgi:branched-subunit amino acid aminotransferase/4-amino-4-deoxychorismate lyase
MKTIYLDGEYKEVNDQLIEAFTPGALKAKGVFETMLGVDGLVMDAELHLERLREGLKALKIKAPTISPAILKIVLQRNQFTTARVRLMVWEAGKEVHAMVAAIPYTMSDKKVLTVCFIETDRTATDRMAEVKSLDYELFANAFEQAQAEGYDEALLLNAKGHIFEASRSNICWMKDSCLYTPPLSSGCLNGITRRQVIKQAKDLQMPVEEKDLTPQLLKTADAAFLTNSLMGIKGIEIKIA